MNLRLWKRQDPSVIPGLEALQEEFPEQRASIRDYLIYAIHGKDRRKLDPEWVERCRAQCEFHRKLFGARS